jgi:nucleoside-diphosphate-sugar epimerase
MSKVLVTGASGFVGSKLARRLCEEAEVEVRVLVRPSSQRDALKGLPVDVVEGAFERAETLAAAVKGVDVVYHVGAQMLKEGVSKARYLEVNAVGTKNLVAACQAAGGLQRFVYLSSAGVYGLVRESPVREDRPAQPTSAYRESKWRAEEVLREAGRQSGFPFVILRVPGVYGPGATSGLDLIRVLRKGGFRTIGTGENRDHLAYITDLVDALLLAGTAAGVEGEAFNIGEAKAVTVNQLTGEICKQLGVAGPVGNLPAAPYYAITWLAEKYYALTGMELPRVPVYAVFLADKELDISKARRLLGYEPKVELAEGIRRTLDWCRETGWK